MRRGAAGAASGASGAAASLALAAAWGDPFNSPNGIYGTPVGSFWLDAGELDHLGPFLGLIGDELTEIGRRTGEHGATKLGKPRLDLGIGECSVALPVELVDDGRGRSLGRAEAPPVAVLVAPHGIGAGRHIWQRLRSGCRGDPERAQLLRLDVLDRRGDGGEHHLP